MSYNAHVIDFRLSWANPGLEEDLDEVDDEDPDACDLLEALFDLLEESDLLRLEFTRTRFQRVNPSPRLDIAPIEWAIRDGLNLSYVKLWKDDGALLPWRIVFAVDESPASRRLVILGVMPRSHDYEKRSPYFDRVERDYDRLRVPRGRPGGH